MSLQDMSQLWLKWVIKGCPCVTRNLNHRGNEGREKIKIEILPIDFGAKKVLQNKKKKTKQKLLRFKSNHPTKQHKCEVDEHERMFWWSNEMKIHRQCHQMTR